MAEIQEVGHDSGKTDDGDHVLDCPADPVCGFAALHGRNLNAISRSTFFLSGMTSSPEAERF